MPGFRGRNRTGPNIHEFGSKLKSHVRKRQAWLQFARDLPREAHRECDYRTVNEIQLFAIAIKFPACKTITKVGQRERSEPTCPAADITLVDQICEKRI